MNLLWRAIEFVVPQGPRDGPEFRKRVEWLMLMRLVVTTFLLGATLFFQLQESGSIFVDAAIPLYVLIGTIFLLSLMYALGLPMIPDLWGFSFFQVMVDVVFATVLIYFTGGAASVFTLLYVFPICAAGILHFRRGALITAAMSAVLFGLLINFLFHGVIPSSDWPWESPWGSFAPGYVVWVLVVHLTIFLVVAILASSVSEQLQRTKVSLNRRELDYRKLSELYTNIVRSIPSGIITTDERDRITFVNTAGTAFLGSPLSELISLPITRIFPVIEDEITMSGSRRATYRTVKEVNDKQIHFELSVSDLKGEDGAPRGRMVVFEDVTQMRKMEERVRQSEKLAAFVRIAAGMAHEIRNPLCSIRGASELLSKASPGSVDNKKLLDIVMRESDRLNGLLTDFMATVGNRSTKRERLLLSALAEETVDLFSGDNRARPQVSVESIINRGVEIEGEPAQLKQVFQNLISNAIDASPEGAAVRVRLVSDPESGHALFTVQDWGSGIPPEIRNRIFEPFTTTKERGTGLGLALVLSIVKQHGGTVEFESTPGVGTSFMVRLPLARVEINTKERESGNG